MCKSMAATLQHLNSGPHDGLLLDNSRSYFTNVGYTRTANHQVEYRDVDPTVPAQLGGTLQYVLPKAGDILGPVDLMIEFNMPNDPGADAVGCVAGWVESVGHAMIEYVEFSLNNTRIERITGEQLYITQELMASEDRRHGTKQVLKTGRPLAFEEVTRVENGTTGAVVRSDVFYAEEDKPKYRRNHGRVIYGSDSNSSKRNRPATLLVPLGLYFTKHPSKYFPIAAVANSNDVRISIKLRSLNELLQLKSFKAKAGADNAAKLDNYLTQGDDGPSIHENVDRYAAPVPVFPHGAIKTSKLRCHYVHVTGPEVNKIMSMEHVRLLKLFQQTDKNFTIECQLPSVVYGSAINSFDRAPTKRLCEIDLQFLHPVTELIVVVRKTSEMGTSISSEAKPYDQDQGARTKGYFNFHGDGTNPNMDADVNCTKEYVPDPAHIDLNARLGTAGGGGAPAQPKARASSEGEGETAGNSRSEAGHGSRFMDTRLLIDNFKLTINGQERHPSLATSGLDTEYLMERIMPMIHTNTDSKYETAHQHDANVDAPSGGGGSSSGPGLKELQKHLHAMKGRKNIYVIPFALNPEGENPSGHLNFSKVSHSKLTISGNALYSGGSATGEGPTTAPNESFTATVLAVNYNWVQLKDGRGWITFA